MPLLNLEQINDAPIPVVQQADAVNAGKWSTRDSGPHGDGKDFTITQLLEDITGPIEKRTEPTAGLSDYDAGMATMRNGLKEKYVNEIKTSPDYESNRQRWMSLWYTTFQHNPGVNISKLISDAVWDKINPKAATPGKYSDFVKIFQDKTTTLSKELVKAIDEVMNALPGLVTPKSIDYNALQTAMDNELNKVLGEFNLDPKADATDPDVIAFKELKDKANDKLDETFEALEQIRTDRPYRTGFDQKTIEDAIKNEFKKSYSTSEWANKLAQAALKKAKAELAGVLSKAKADALDTRTLDVIEEFNEWVHKQTGPKPKTPPELFKSLLGDATGQEFLDWINKWGKLFVVSHSESVAPDQSTGGEKVVISMGISLIDGVAPITGLPQLKVSYKWLDAAGFNTKETFVNTPPLKVMKSSYSTDLALEAYKKIIDKITEDSTMSEDNFKDFLAALSPSIDVASLKSGQKWNDIPLATLETLNPEVFKGFQSELDQIITSANLQQYAKGTVKWTSALEMKFDIEYVETKGVMSLKITPHIIDKNIANIPPVEWDPSIPATQAAKDTTKKQIEDFFTIADKLHEEITSPVAKAISERVIAPLYSKAAEIAKALKSGELSPFPFAAEYNGKIALGEEVPLKFMEDNFPMATKALQYFDDPKSRFKIKFIISDLKTLKVSAGEQQQMSVTYTITDSTVTDTKDPFYSIDKNPNDQSPLVKEGILFNAAMNKAETWLEKIVESDKGRYETSDKLNFDHKQYVDDIAKRVPLEMSKAEFDAVFKEYQDIKNTAFATDAVTITKGKIEYDVNSGRWLQHFTAEYTAKSGAPVTADKAIPFTERFLSQQEVSTVQSDIDDKTKAATKTIDESAMTDQEKKDFLLQMNAEKSALDDQIKSLNTNPKEPDIHEAQAMELEDAAAEFNVKALAAIQDALIARAKGEIVKHFGDLDHVPPKILELLAKYPDGMMKILKNNPGLLDNVDQLEKLLEKYGDTLDPNAIADAQKTLQKSGKWFLLSLGGLLGIGALLGGANAAKVATTNRKSLSSTGKIKSSKKLAIISALIGLASAAGSVATLVYLFVAQGGL